MDEFPSYHHPVLGELYNEDVDWVADEANLAVSVTPTQVCLCQGTEDGPSQEALYGFDWVNSNWPTVLGLIQDEAFRWFYLPYADAHPSIPRFTAPSELWGSEVLIAISIISQDDFTVTMRFDWQHSNDPHEVTFYIEERKCQTHSVDG